MGFWDWLTGKDEFEEEKKEEKPPKKMTTSEFFRFALNHTTEEILEAYEKVNYPDLAMPKSELSIG